MHSEWFRLPKMLEIRESFDKALAANGIPPNSNRVMCGIGEEQILSIDEAIDVLREYKALEDAIPVPALKPVNIISQS